MRWTSSIIWVCVDCAKKVNLLDPIAHAMSHKNLGRCPLCTARGPMVKLRTREVQARTREIRRATGLSYAALEFDPKVTLRQEPARKRLPKPNYKWVGGTWQACPSATERLKRAASSRV